MERLNKLTFAIGVEIYNKPMYEPEIITLQVKSTSKIIPKV